MSLRVHIHRAAWSFALFAALASAPTPAGAHPDSLTVEEIDSLKVYLIASLAAPDERAYLQILTDVQILADPTDSSRVYDIVVRFDPERFHSPYAGLYPLTFEDQFIQWGKRIALFTRSISPTTRRFYLHDISTGQQAWMFTAEARHLYSLPPDKTPAMAAVDDRGAQRRWLRLILDAPVSTELLTMGGWLRLIRRETRGNVIARIGVYQPPPAATTTP